MPEAVVFEKRGSCLCFAGGNLSASSLMMENVFPFFVVVSECFRRFAPGEEQTVMPAFSIARILSGAAPEPPEMMAPAWPIRRPGGAVCPAMKPTTGFFTFAPM